MGSNWACKQNRGSRAKKIEGSQLPLDGSHHGGVSHIRSPFIQKSTFKLNTLKFGPLFPPQQVLAATACRQKPMQAN